MDVCCAKSPLHSFDADRGPVHIASCHVGDQHIGWHRLTHRLLGYVDRVRQLDEGRADILDEGARVVAHAISQGGYRRANVSGLGRQEIASQTLQRDLELVA